MSRNPDTLPDAEIPRLLRSVKTIALVGASAKPERASHRVMKYLQAKGYRVLPVNPGLAGRELLGETVHASLADAPGPYEMVDVFRNAGAALGVTEEAVALADEKGIRAIWMQLGVVNDAAAAAGRAAGLEMVMDRCPKIELERRG